MEINRREREQGELPSLPEEISLASPCRGTMSLHAMVPNAGVFPGDCETISNVGTRYADARPLAQPLQRDRHELLESASGSCDQEASFHPLDLVQAGLGVLGMADFFPPVAVTADALNTAISAWRGDATGASLGAAAIAPGLGLGASVANVAHHLKPIQILLSPRAQKELKKLPKEIRGSLEEWADDVKQRGLEEVRQINGYNDKPIHFGEHKGRRSIRLNHVYRAFYSKLTNGHIQVEAVNRHEYNFTK